MAQAAYRIGLDRIAYRLFRYSPGRLHQRLLDRRFDRQLGVETGGPASLRGLTITSAHSAQGLGYEPSPAERVREMLRSVELRHQDFVFVDFGSGKGKVLLLAAELPFQKVIGVEFSRELHQIARANIERLRLDGRVESIWADATDFPVPEGLAVLYFFNPFKELVLSRVLSNIEQSLSAHPRPIFIIFYAPVLRGSPWDRRPLLDRAPFLRCIRSEKDYAVYASNRLK